MAGSSSANIASSISPQGSSSKKPSTDLLYGDLLLEILSWLPVVSLLRFRFVCKSWFNLITHDSTLVKMHLLHHHNLQFDKCCPAILFGKENYETFYSLNLNMDANKDELIDPSQGSELVHSFKNPKFPAKSFYFLDFLGSCNGLICIKVYNCSNEYRWIDESIIYIWNPSTKEFKQLPDSPIECPMNSDRGPAFVITYGFGYDQKIDDYKVIRCVQDSNITDEKLEQEYHGLGSELKVYTLGTNSWRRIHQHIPYRITKCWRNRSKPGLLVNGSLHWVCSSSSRFDRIISFDIVDEEYREVPKPDNLGHDDIYVKLQELRGCLCLHYRIRHPPTLCIWMMKDYGEKESWTKLFTINHPVVVQNNLHLTPLWLFKNGKILIGMSHKDMLVLCDPKSNEIKFLMSRKMREFECSKISYIGSLVSLKSGTYTYRKQVKQDEEDLEQAMGGEDDPEETNNLTSHEMMVSMLSNILTYMHDQAFENK